MSENVAVAIIGVLGIVFGAVVAGAVTWYVTLRKMPKEMRVLNSEEQENLSIALSNAVLALNNTLAAANAQRMDFEKRINELEAHRDMRSREIYTLQQNLEKLNRESARETQELRDTIRVLQTQVDEGNKKYENLKKQTLKMYQAMQEANLKIDIDPDFRDTLERMKALK